MNYRIRLKNGETIELIVHETLSPDQVYEHEVRNNVYNLFTGGNRRTNIDRSVINSFLLDLRKRI